MKDGTQGQDYHMTCSPRKVAYWALLTQAPYQVVIVVYLLWKSPGVFYSHLLILWLHPESLSPYCDLPDPAILAYIPLTLVGGPIDFMYAWSDSKDLRYPHPNGLIHLNWMQLEDLYPEKFLRRRSGSAGSILTLSKIWLKDSVYHLRLLFIIIALSHEPNEGFLFCFNKRIGFLQFTHLFVKSPQLANHTGCPILEILQHLFDIQPMWQV